jgi:cytochrome c5
MKKTVALLGLCLPLVLFTQCGKKEVVAKSTISVADEIAGMKNKYNEKQMAEGKVIFENSCGECHDLHQPADFKVGTWDKILPKMCRKAKLSSEQAALVRAWIITNAKAG